MKPNILRKLIKRQSKRYIRFIFYKKTFKKKTVNIFKAEPSYYINRKQIEKRNNYKGIKCIKIKNKKTKIFSQK